MENYRRAYEERLRDQQALAESGRYVAAVHFGGVVIECLLKAMRVELDGIKEWHSNGDPCEHCGHPTRPARPQPHGVMNPGHDLMGAVTKWQRLWNRISKMPPQQQNFYIGLLSTLKNPMPGNANIDFIALRYECVFPRENAYEEWLIAFKRCHHWLLSQETELRKRR